MYTVETYVIEILATLIGLSYPFIMQIITRIDDKYHSVNLVSLFNREPVYKIYTFVLMMTILVAILVPFTKVSSYNGNATFQIISFQGFSFFFLLITLIYLYRLFKLIGVYYIPKKLHQRVQDFIESQYDKKENNNDSQVLPWWQKITQYLSNTNNKNQTTHNVSNDDLCYNCLSDLLRYGIKSGDRELYINVKTTFYYCMM